MPLQTSPIQDTAILIFANSAVEDSRIKHIGAEVSLFDSLTRQTLKIARDTGLPYYHFTEEEQWGKTFAERFSNSLNQVFNLGYDQVISIGNDSPHLTTAHLKKAHESLSRRTVVLGPSLDGGFYLLGLHRSNFHKESFKALPWQHTQLYKKTLEYFESKGCTVQALDKLIDIDSVEDIKLLSNFIKSLSRKWVVLFSNLFALINKFANAGFTTPRQVLHPIPFNKGSPSLFA